MFDLSATRLWGGGPNAFQASATHRSSCCKVWPLVYTVVYPGPGALMRGLVVAGVLLVALTSRADADDLSSSMAVKAPATVKTPTAVNAPAAPHYDWSGFYVGGHVAYSLGRADSTLSDPAPTPSSNAFGSLYGGLQAGYNYVLPSRLLLGIEADITFPYFFENGTIFTGGTAQGTTVSDQIDYIATLRGRFGYAFDHWLIYATGGLAWSQARFGETPGVASDEDLDPTHPRRARRLASAPSSRSHRAGRRGSNISTTASEASPASFRRARVTSRSSISRRCGSGSTTSSAQRTPTHRRMRAAIRGRSHPATGMSTANSRPSSRAIRPSARRTRVRTASPAPAKPRIR